MDDLPKKYRYLIGAVIVAVVLVAIFSGLEWTGG